MIGSCFRDCCCAPGQVSDASADIEVQGSHTGIHQYDHRIAKELRRLQSRKPKWLDSVAPVNGDIRVWRATLSGPTDTPYEGGTFQLEITLPAAYPYEQPHIKFVTKIYHVNVDFQDGDICCSDFQWEPATTISHLINVIFDVMSIPDAPLNLSADEKAQADLPPEKDMVRLFYQERAQYENIARQWTEKYAM